MRLPGCPLSPRSPDQDLALGRSESLLQHPGTRCFFQRGANRSRRMQRMQTPGAGDCAHSSPSAGRGRDPTRHPGLSPRGAAPELRLRAPTALTHCPQMRPWCRHAGTPLHGVGILASLSGDSQHRAGGPCLHRQGSPARGGRPGSQSGTPRRCCRGP